MAFRIAVLASGGGTNLQAILDQLHGGGEVEVVGVVSDKPDAMALERAHKAGVESAVFRADEHADRDARDAAIAEWLEQRDVDTVVLAGYMQLLSPGFVERFRNRIVRAPRSAALFSRAGGRPAGTRTHRERITGVTVHFVDEGVDSGPIIFQRPVPVPPSRDWDELERAIHATSTRCCPRRSA